MAQASELIELGKIVRPHGYKGELVAVCPGGRQCAIATVPEVYIGRTSNDASPYQLIEAAWMPKGWKLRLSALTSDGEVNALRGQSVFALRVHLPAMEPGEYYIADLIGSTVIDADTKAVVGKFVLVERTSPEAFDPPHDVWWIRLENGGQLGVPATQRYVREVDAQKREIHLAHLSDLA